MDENKPKKCYFCGDLCTDEDYCWGCKEFICLDCDEQTPLLDEHIPNDHQLRVDNIMKEMGDKNEMVKR